MTATKIRQTEATEIAAERDFRVEIHRQTTGDCWDVRLYTTASGYVAKGYNRKRDVAKANIGDAIMRMLDELNPEPVTKSETGATVTAQEIARSIGVAPRTKRYILRDENGFAYDGRHYSHVFGALGRSDKTPDLSSRIHTVAYALFKSMTSGRMPAESENRIAVYSPYRMCALVARIANECPETTIGGICDIWIADNHASF